MTTQEAAEFLSVSVRRIQALISHNRIAAIKKGRDWDIAKQSLERFQRSTPGRPRKEKP